MREYIANKLFRYLKVCHSPALSPVTLLSMSLCSTSYGTNTPCIPRGCVQNFSYLPLIHLPKDLYRTALLGTLCNQYGDSNNVSRFLYASYSKLNTFQVGLNVFVDHGIAKTFKIKLMFSHKVRSGLSILWHRSIPLFASSHGLCTPATVLLTLLRTASQFMSPQFL